MNDVATRVERTGFYAGQNRWVAIAVKVIVVALVLWASLAADAGRILMEFQSATIGYFGGWYVYASAAFMIASYSSPYCRARDRFVLAPTTAHRSSAGLRGFR